MTQSWRSATAVRILLVGALVSTAGVGAYSFSSQNEGSSKQSQSRPSSDSKASAASFTTADSGSCLTWKDGAGKITNFEQADCAGEHRFEVSSREDLRAYPASEFGDEAPMPDLTRQAQLREELCLNPTIQYLKGTFDQMGKYSVASILPPQDAWSKGDRTLLCGIQATDDKGALIPTSGRAAEQDQSRIFRPNECVLVDAASATRVVDCGAEHQLEITAIVDLQPVFPEGTPSLEQQDKHLQQVCTQAAQDYLGGDDPLYFSTLQPFWTTLPENSWAGGSRSVNCALVFGQDRKFATLAGSAKTGFTINGQPPASPPVRAPIVNPEALIGPHPEPAR